MKRKGKKIVALLLMVTMTVAMLGATAFASPQPRDPDLCYVNTSDGSNLNGRSGPGTQYSVICKYANGTQLFWSVMPDQNATDSQGRSWLCVSGKTTTGVTMQSWVCEDYLRFVTVQYNLKNITVESNPELPAVG